MKMSDLPKDVQDELLDANWWHRKHYSRGTYASGCHGPLCRKAERDRGHERYEERARAAGKGYTAVYNARGDQEHEARLQTIVDWYLEVRADRNEWLRTIILMAVAA